MMGTESDEREDFGNGQTKIEDEESISVVKERVSIGTRSTITSEVIVDKTVHTQQVDIPLTDIDITYREQRIPVNRVVDVMPTVRYEGDNLIVPVVREEEVVVKRLVLVEEIHLIKDVRRTERTQTVELQSEEVAIKRRNPGQTP